MSETQYQIIVSTAAAKQIRKLPEKIRDQILDSIEDLELDPRPSGCKKLAGRKGAYRIKVAVSYRIIYEIDDGVLSVLVVRAAHRREVYR